MQGLKISELAAALGKQAEERVLPNGRQVNMLVWEPDDLKDISRLLHSQSSSYMTEGGVLLDGAAPAWLVAGIAHELHPAVVYLPTPQGEIPIGCKTPEGTGYGENLEFSMEPRDNWLVIEMAQQDPSVPLDLTKTSEIVPPALPEDVSFKGVLLSGRMPNLVMASVAQAYQHQPRVGAVGLCQATPEGLVATVSITHNPEISLGTQVKLQNTPKAKL